MSEIGDWAFDFALELARRNDTKLNVFFFPTSPCEEHTRRGRWGELMALADENHIALEREIRLYYEDRLGDYFNVGFRLCLGDETPELRRCLAQHEYTVLVLAYEGRHCPLGESPIEQFAERMQCSVVLIGPESRDEIYLNSPASLFPDQLGLQEGQWMPVIADSSTWNIPSGAESHMQLKDKTSLVAQKKKRTGGKKPKPVGPIKVVHDRDGNCWLCPVNVDESGDLRAQGCWRCEDVLSTGNSPQE
jgi:hypothetical protein